MAWNENGRGREMICLASGIALGALGASLVLGENGARRRLTDTLGVTQPERHRGFFWPWGALIAGGAVAAGLASVAPDLARYIKIEMM